MDVGSGEKSYVCRSRFGWHAQAIRAYFSRRATIAAAANIAAIHCVIMFSFTFTRLLYDSMYSVST